MARIGKIARMPAEVREELNQRLRGGELGPQILPWLNSHPEAVRVLGEHFNGQPVNAQNLSDWRQGGYAEWEERQERTHRVKELARFASDLAAANGSSIAEGAAAIASGRLLEILEATPEGPMDAGALKGVVNSLVSLRMAELGQARVDLDAEKLKRKDEEILLAKQKFEQQLKEYQDQVQEQKREIEGALAQARDGGITPETLERIEQAAKLL
jgi:hypothetical protein